MTSLLDDSDPQKKVLEDYQTAYGNKYSAAVSGFGGYAYDAVKLLAGALKGSGGDKEKIRDNLEATKGYVGATGEFNFTPEDHNGLSPAAFVMVKIKNGTWTLLK